MNQRERDEAVERELFDVAHGDLGRLRLLRTSLERLSSGAGGAEMAELARDVLAGRASLRQAVLSQSYGQVVEAHFNTFVDWWETLTPQQRQQAGQAGKAQLEQLRAEESEDRQRRGRRHGASDS